MRFTLTRRAFNGTVADILSDDDVYPDLRSAELSARAMFGADFISIRIATPEDIDRLAEEV